MHWLDDLLFAKHITMPLSQVLSADMIYLAIATWSYTDIATNLRRETAYKQIEFPERLKYYVDMQKVALVRIERTICDFVRKLK